MSATAAEAVFVVFLLLSPVVGVVVAEATGYRSATLAPLSAVAFIVIGHVVASNIGGGS